jgi:hypothetical protein
MDVADAGSWTLPGSYMNTVLSCSLPVPWAGLVHWILNEQDATRVALHEKYIILGPLEEGPSSPSARKVRAKRRGERARREVEGEGVNCRAVGLDPSQEQGASRKRIGAEGAWAST